MRDEQQLASVDILRVSGPRETHQVGKHILLDWIRRMIGADAIDAVNLRDADGRITGKIMLVDDTGMIDGKPINPEATTIYHAQCKPGTPYSIHGDVAIAVDEDFA